MFSICIVSRIIYFSALSCIYLTSFGQANIRDLIIRAVKADNKLYDLYELNVKNYYQLENRPEFSSELKTKLYMQSTEYKSMLKALQVGKNDIFKYTYYIQDDQPVIGNYQLSCKCFTMDVGHLYLGLKYLADINYPVKRNILYFDDGLVQRGPIVYVHNKVAIAVDPLPVKKPQNSSPFFNSGVLNIPVSEKIALQMENSEHMSVYYFFNAKAYQKNVYSYTEDMIFSSERKRKVHRLFIADGLRVVVADDATGKIFYDKIYSQSGSFLIKGVQTVITSITTNPVGSKVVSETAIGKLKITGELDMLGWTLGSINFANPSDLRQGQVNYQIQATSDGSIISANPLSIRGSINDATEEILRNQILQVKLQRNALIKPLDLSMGTLRITIDYLTDSNNSNNSEAGNSISDKVNPNRKTNTDEFYGTPGGAPTGVAFDVPGWSLASRPNVNDETDETGKLVFQLKVDSNGSIIDVRQLQCTVSPSLGGVYQQAVQKLRLRPKSGVTPIAATGTITFIITAK